MRFSAAFYESIFTQHGMTVDEIAGKYHVSRQIIIDDLTALGLYNPDSTDSIAEHEREYDHTAIGSTAHNHTGADINSGTIDGDRLPGLDAVKKGGVPATGVASGKYLKDNGTWDMPPGAGYTATGIGDSAVVAGNTSVTVAHGCGVKPDWVGVTPGLGFEAPFEVRDGDMDATNFIVRLSGGIVLGANANFKWLAIKI